MKSIFVTILSVSLILTSCTFLSSPPNTSNPTSDPNATAIPWDEYSIFRNGLVTSQQSVLDETNGSSVYHIEITISENLYYVTGTEEVQYTNTENVSLSVVQFRLFPNILGGEMTISNLTVNGQPVTPSYQLDNSLLIVPLASSLAPNHSVLIKMDYEVNVPQDLDLNYGVLSYSDDILTLAHSYPMICVYDDEGWNAEMPSQNGDVTYSDAAFYIVRIHAPKRLTLVTSGSEVSHHKTGQTQSLTIASGPARDFYLAASPYFEEISKKVGEVTIHSYAPKQSKDGSRLALEVASRSMEIFNERYTPYPYTEFDIVSTPTITLGIEYPGIVAITSRIYDVNGVYNNDPASLYLESTVAHEMGHQWFYNLVGNDQLDDPWLDESLTQFITLQYFTDEYGERGMDGFLAGLEMRWARVENANIPIGMPVAYYQDNEYGPIIYGRGPLFFVELQKEMGKEAFDAFLKEYAVSLSWKIATPGYLHFLAEENCLCDLDTLFDEWVYP